LQPEHQCDVIVYAGFQLIMIVHNYHQTPVYYYRVTYVIYLSVFINNNA